MKSVITTAMFAMMFNQAIAQPAHTQVQVSAQVNAYVRASNTQTSPTVQTNSHDVRCTVANKDGYTVVTC